MTLLGRDNGLVQHLHYVVLNLRPGETREAPGETGDETLAPRDFERPIEEVRFDDSADLGLGKQRTAQQSAWGDARVGDVDTDDRVAHDFSHGNEKGVADEQCLLIPEVGTESGTEQFCPQLAL